MKNYKNKVITPLGTPKYLLTEKCTTTLLNRHERDIRSTTLFTAILF